MSLLGPADFSWIPLPYTARFDKLGVLGKGFRIHLNGFGVDVRQVQG